MYSNEDLERFYFQYQMKAMFYSNKTSIEYKVNTSTCGHLQKCLYKGICSKLSTNSMIEMIFIKH